MSAGSGSTLKGHVRFLVRERAFPYRETAVPMQRYGSFLLGKRQFPKRVTVRKL